MAMLEKGKYRAKALEAGLGYTSTGKPQVAVRFELLDVTTNRSWYGFLHNDEATEITLKALRACGWKGNDFTDLSGVTDNEVELVIDHEKYGEKTLDKVKWVNKLGGGKLEMKKPIEGDALKAFAAEMKGKVLAFDQKAGAPRQAGVDDVDFP